MQRNQRGQHHERAHEGTRIHPRRAPARCAGHIYFDAVPTAGFRGPVLSVILALIVGVMVSKTNAENHVVAVGNLRMTAGAAEQLRDVLGKALLAAQPTAGSAN